MKKIFSLVCLAMFCLVVPLCGCKKTTFEGTYTVKSLSCMGLSATQQSFKSYNDTRSENDKNYNSLYKPLSLLFNLKLELKDEGNASLSIKDFKSTLKNDSHYTRALNSAMQKGYVTGENLEISNLKWTIDKSQDNSYYIFAVDEDGEKMSLSQIWGDTLFSCDHIHARIENGQLACKLKVCIYEKENEEKSNVVLTTNVTIVLENN